MDPDTLPTYNIKLFETMNRFLVLLHLQLSLGFIDKRLTMSRNRRKYF